MCKGCMLGDTVGYLDGFSTPFEHAAHDIKCAKDWLRRTAHTTKNENKKRHLLNTKSRLELVAKELSSIRDEFLKEANLDKETK